MAEEEGLNLGMLPHGHLANDWFKPLTPLPYFGTFDCIEYCILIK